MRTRDLNQDEEQRIEGPGGAPAPGSSEGNGDELRERARRLLEFGDATISNALSQDSARFLDQNRQQGGQ